MDLDPSPGRELFRWTMWPFWIAGTWAAGHGGDVFEDAALLFTILIPLFPILSIFLFLDLARLRRAQVARRFMGRENYARYRAEFRRIPEVPALWSWPVRTLLLIAPFALFGIVVVLKLADGRREAGWELAIGYSGLLSLTQLMADVWAGSRYRRGGAWTR